jgi:hypothetical protein
VKKSGVGALDGSERARATQKGITAETQREAFTNKGLAATLSVCLSRNVSYLKRIGKGEKAPGNVGFLLFSASLWCDVVAATGQKHAGRSARAT